MHGDITHIHPPPPPPPPVSSAGRFTDLPSNMTVKEGQNIEMACAFQSATASVYLEIQWWFVKAPEPTDSSEDVDAEEVQMDLFLPPFPTLPLPTPPVRALFAAHPLVRGIRAPTCFRAITHERTDVIGLVLVQQQQQTCSNFSAHLLLTRTNMLMSLTCLQRVQNNQ